MSTDSPIVLVTGATGFIGRHLAPALAARGWRVRAASRRAVMPAVPGVAEWVDCGELSARTDWSRALREVVAVVHLAALAHRTDPRQQPAEEEFLEVNAGGTRSLAAAARAGGIRRFIFVSSIGAVTDGRDELVDEAAYPAPNTPYGRSKLAAERALQETLAGSRVEWSVLRPVLVYGPGNPGNMARLLQLVKSGLPLPLGGICNRRSFVYVGNLVDAMATLLAEPGMSGRVFNVADDQAVSTPELLGLIADAAGRPLRMWRAPRWSLHLAARGGDAASGLGLKLGLDSYSLRRLEGSLVVSNAALRCATTWRPRTTLAEGLRTTLHAEAAAGKAGAS